MSTPHMQIVHVQYFMFETLTMFVCDCVCNVGVFNKMKWKLCEICFFIYTHILSCYDTRKKF